MSRSWGIKNFVILLNSILITVLACGVLFCFVVPINFYIEVPGTVESKNQVILKTQNEGVIEKIYFEEGSKVVEGATILKLNDPNISADRVSIEMKFEEAKQNYENYLILYKKGIVSRNEYLGTERKYEIAKVQLENLEGFYIKAPMSGTLVSNEELWLKEGDYVKAGTMIARIVDLDNMTVRVFIPENRVSKVKIGQRAVIFVNALPYLKNKTLDGEVIKILPEAKPIKEGMVFIALVKIKNPSIKTEDEWFRLLPMMTAKVRILHTHKTVFNFLIKQKIGI